MVKSGKSLQGEKSCAKKRVGRGQGKVSKQVVGTGLKTAVLRPVCRHTNNRNSGYRLTSPFPWALLNYFKRYPSPVNITKALAYLYSLQKCGAQTFPPAELLLNNFYTPADCISPQIPYQLSLLPAIILRAGHMLSIFISSPETAFPSTIALKESHQPKQA